MVQIPGSETELKCDLLLIAAGFTGVESYVQDALHIKMSKRILKIRPDIIRRPEIFQRHSETALFPKRIPECVIAGTDSVHQVKSISKYVQKPDRYPELCFLLIQPSTSSNDMKNRLFPLHFF